MSSPQLSPAPAARCSTLAPLCLLLGLSLLGAACGDGQGRENNTFDTLEDESGDASGSSESDDTSADCPVGSLDCPCTPGGFCDGELVCSEDICQLPSGDGDGDGDGDASGDGDGDGDASGDGDGDGAQGCGQDLFIEIEAVDADEILGWTPTMSMFEEGLVLAHEEDVREDYVRFNLTIPCEDDWHVWVRGTDLTTMDSYFVSIDGFPNPQGIFELDCTPQPNDTTYVWKELNYRDAENDPCESIADPWVFAWSAGPHTLELRYRESLAVARIYVTNSESAPR